MRKAQDILQAAGTIMVDEGFVHWTLPELCIWLNFGLDAISLAKPNSTSKTVNVPLVAGTMQAIPTGYTTILRPVRNIKGPSADSNPRKRITVVSEQSLTSFNPFWDDETSVPYAQQAKHFIFDEANPKAFYVYPGNNGTGQLEMVLSAVAEKVVIAAGAEADALISYSMPVPLDETYHDALMDYILYRAYSKDMQFAGSAQRAGWHYQNFANAIGIKTTVEAEASPNNRTITAPAASGASN